MAELAFVQRLFAHELFQFLHEELSLEPVFAVVHSFELRRREEVGEPTDQFQIDAAHVNRQVYNFLQVLGHELQREFHQLRHAQVLRTD